MTSDNDKNIQDQVSFTPINTPPIFTISPKGKITFGDTVKNYPHDEQAREFVKCVEQIVVNQPQGVSYQLGYDKARAEVIEEVRKVIWDKQTTLYNDPNIGEFVDDSSCERAVLVRDLESALDKLERGEE